MVFVNATPHEIKIFKEDKKTLLRVIQPGPFIIRLKTKKQIYIGHVEDIPIYTNQEFIGVEVSNKEGGIERIEIEKGKVYIVSFYVKEWVDKHHKDLSSFFYIPDSNEGGVRENGVLLGTTRLLN